MPSVPNLLVGDIISLVISLSIGKGVSLSKMELDNDTREPCVDFTHLFASEDRVKEYGRTLSEFIIQSR